METFHDLYIRHMPILHAFANRYTFDSEIARDLVHDAFLWLWDHPEKINTDQNIVHLLRIMVRNNCLNYLRRLKIEDRHSDKLIESILLSSENYWLEDADDLDIQLKERIQDILGKLSEKSRSILTDHFVEGKKIKEIAQQYGIAESTIKTHLKRAVKMIREHLSLLIFLIFID